MDYIITKYKSNTLFNEDPIILYEGKSISCKKLFEYIYEKLNIVITVKKCEDYYYDRTLYYNYVSFEKGDMYIRYIFETFMKEKWKSIIEIMFLQNIIGICDDNKNLIIEFIIL